MIPCCRLKGLGLPGFFWLFWLLDIDIGQPHRCKPHAHTACAQHACKAVWVQLHMLAPEQASKLAGLLDRQRYDQHAQPCNARCMYACTMLHHTHACMYMHPPWLAQAGQSVTRLSMHGTKGGRPGGVTARVLSPPLPCVTLRADSSAPPVALMLRPLEPAHIQASTHMEPCIHLVKRFVFRGGTERAGASGGDGSTAGCGVVWCGVWPVAFYGQGCC